MFDLELSEDDKKWVEAKYPGLTVTTEKGVQVVSGLLEFNREYGGKSITDTYNISIEMQASPLSDLPKVSEIGHRIEKSSQYRNTPASDLHTYEHDWSVCLCVRPAEVEYFPDGFSFPIFMEDLVEPFFYAQSYVEKYGVWPWPTASHGLLGWLEWYHDKDDITPEIISVFLEALQSQYGPLYSSYGLYGWEELQEDLLKRNGVKGHHWCPCNSKRKYRDCHEKALRGTWKLNNDLRRFGISIV